MSLFMFFIKLGVVIFFFQLHVLAGIGAIVGFIIAGWWMDRKKGLT